MGKNRTYKINDAQATAEEWESLKQLFPDVQGGRLSPFADKELDSYEIRRLLDANRDGRISNDFSGWQAGQFDQLAQILSRHGGRLATGALLPQVALYSFG